MRIAASAFRLSLAVAFCGALALAHGAHPAARAASQLPEPFDPTTMDRSANVCKDFFAYATGGWRKTHAIPPAYSEYGYIELLVDQTRDILRATLDDARLHPGPAGGEKQKIGDFYGSCLDTAAIERAGLQPIAPELARIATLHNRAALAAEIAHLHEVGVDAGFSVNATQDDKDSRSIIAEFDQGGIGLPERDYYLRQDADSRGIRAKYRMHVTRMLALSGDARAAADADSVLAFETELARGSMPAADLRDPLATYHPQPVARVATLLPHFALRTYLVDAHIPSGGAKVNVAEPAFLRTVDRLAATAPLGQWRAYLRWRLLDADATMLPHRFEDEAFDFNGRVLEGAKAQLPRWKRCITVTGTLLGEAVGRAYVAQTFPPAAKQRAMDMTLRIRAAYRAEMAALPWMTAATKRTAIAKLDAMGLKVGYPDRWRRYNYTVAPAAYFMNVERGRTFERQYQLEQIGKPLDTSRWSMTPQTVNAYNDPQRNEIVLPAAQLQRPFFDADAVDADNLGATGAGTVGHEMTHGFDDEGHKFDLHGNLVNWWTPGDLTRFDARAQCVIKQFDNTVAIGNLHYQGRLDSGEAIADLGGVTIGYRALETSLAGKSHAPIDGFTPEQRYFLAFAQSWTEFGRPEAEKREVLSDPHPLPRDRVNNTVANVPGWYDAFNCPKPPHPVCVVW